mgnify:CR=1 FL=1
MENILLAVVIMSIIILIGISIFFWGLLIAVYHHKNSKTEEIPSNL